MKTTTLEVVKETKMMFPPLKIAKRGLAYDDRTSKSVANATRAVSQEH